MKKKFYLLFLLIFCFILNFTFSSCKNANKLKKSDEPSLYEIVHLNHDVDTIYVWNSEGKDMIWLITEEGHSYIEYIPYKKNVTDKTFLHALFLYNIKHYRKLMSKKLK